MKNRLNLAEIRLGRRWNWIKSRCFNPKREAYINYGGRGIGIYEPWISDKLLFIEYCKTLSGWDNLNLTLDRINNDGNYEPGNLRFTSRVIQSRNRRLKIDNKTGYRGITIEVMPSGNIRYRASVGIDNRKIQIGSFKTAEDAYNARRNYIKKFSLYGYTLI